MTIRTRTVKLTPSLAKKYMEMNHPKNRRLAVRHIDNLAEAIRLDLWKLDGSTIKFSNGTPRYMLDGQHRCMAVIAARKPIQTLVTVGLDEESFHTLDQGRIRTAADFLMQHKNRFALASAARMCMHLLETRQAGKKYDGRRKAPGARPDNTAVVSWVEEHPKLGKIVDKVAARPKVRRFGNLSTICFLYWWFSMKSMRDAEIFFGAVFEGNTGRDSPMWVLREKLLGDINLKGKQDTRELMVMYVNAWNAFREGRKMKSAHALGLAAYRKHGTSAFPMPR